MVNQLQPQPPPQQLPPPPEKPPEGLDEPGVADANTDN